MAKDSAGRRKSRVNQAPTISVDVTSEQSSTNSPPYIRFHIYEPYIGLLDL